MQKIVIAQDANRLAKRVGQDLIAAVKNAAAENLRFRLALSGGSTPRLLYELLAGPDLVAEMPWGSLELFWGDERCVPPTDADSNFLMVRQAMLDHVPLPPSQIHRVWGEATPAGEAARYAQEIRLNVPAPKGKLPRFDWVLLGMGDDGHTASLFPGQTLADQNDLCGIAKHPSSGQQRLSFTYDLLNAAGHVAFVVTGANKAAPLAAIIRGVPEGQKFPASRIDPRSGTHTWYLDSAAAGKLSEHL